MYQQLSLFAEPIPETLLESVDPFSYDHIFNEPVILAKGSWRLPAGARGEKTGPT